jgi:hypothetical protein
LESVNGLDAIDRAAIAYKNALTVFPRLRRALERNGVAPIDAPVEPALLALPNASN